MKAADRPLPARASGVRARQSGNNRQAPKPEKSCKRRDVRGLYGSDSAQVHRIVRRRAQWTRGAAESARASTATAAAYK